MQKRGQLEPVNWLFNILKGAGGLIVALFIVAGLAGVIWFASSGKSEEELRVEADMKRVLDATEVLIKEFDQGKIYGNAYLPAPIKSQNGFKMAFYPATGGIAKPPADCKGETCICLFFIAGNKIKQSCEIVQTKDKCTAETCGKELCAGPYTEFTVKDGNAVKVEIACTDKGSQLSITKI
jgi:hypothetical protein